MRISLQKLFIKNHWTLLQDFINLKKMKTCNSIRTRGKQPLEIATCSIANQCIKLVPFFFFWIIELAHQKFRVWGLDSVEKGILLFSPLSLMASVRPFLGPGRLFLLLAIHMLAAFQFLYVVCHGLSSDSL